MQTSLFLLLGLAASAAVLPAQNSTIAGIGNVGAIMPPVIAVQRICTPADGCTTALPPPPAPFAGAAAWDDVLGALWVSEGTSVSIYLPANGCNPPFQCPCPPLCGPWPWPYPNSFITGMAIDSYQRILWIADHQGWIRWYSIAGPCALQPMGGCQVPLPPGTVITGLAFDKLSGSILFVTSIWAPITPGSSILHVAPALMPCQPFCVFPLPGCPGAPFMPATGLAFDPCSRHAIVTDGGLLMSVAWRQPCAFQVVGCCPSAPVNVYIGLGLMRSACPPAFAGSRAGSWTWMPCVGHGCPQCPAVVGTAGGLPQIGNPSFALTLNQGPNPAGFAAAALLLVNWSNGCTPQRIPFPCGGCTLFPALDAFFWSALVPPAAGGLPPCGLAASFPLPIPLLPQLCGYRFCGQWAVLDLNPANPGNWCLTFSQQFDVQIGG